jgi:hypothetical protein
VTVRGYGLFVDWSRHGTFANALEDVTSYISDDTNIEMIWGRARAGEMAAVGQLTFGLRNDGRWFSSENTSSPIAGRILPGPEARASYTHPSTGTITTFLAGQLDDFAVDPHAADRRFSATVLDGWGVPGAEKLATAVHTGKRTGELIGVVLDAIGWTGPRDLDAGATVVDWWWEDGTDAATAVQRLVQSEGPPAIAYVEAGTFVFRDRHHRLTRAASQISQGTYTHVVPALSGPAGQLRIAADTFTFDHGLKNITNSVTFEVQQRVPGNPTQVWSSETPIALGANESQTIVAQATDPFINAQTPMPYQFNSDGAIGSGEYGLLGGGPVTITLSRTSGQSTLITIAAGASGAYLYDGIRLQATPLPVARTFQVTEEDAASIGTFRRQSWADPVPWANVFDARAIAQHIIAIYATPRPTVTFSIDNLDATALAQILARRVSDRITVRNDPIGLNADFMIEGVAHSIRKLGKLPHRLTLRCEIAEPTQPANAFTFDVAGKGFNDGAFGIAGIDNASTVFTFDVAGKGFDQGVFAT